MTYIENVFACIAAPLLIAALCAGRANARYFVFALAGMLACLLSAYVNTFFAVLLDASALGATAEIVPVVEEIMKLLPLLFYLLVFEPEGDKIRAAILVTAVGFATFENVCFLIENGADDLGFLLIRAAWHGGSVPRDIQPARGLWRPGAVRGLRAADSVARHRVCGALAICRAGEKRIKSRILWPSFGTADFLRLGESFPTFEYLYKQRTYRKGETVCATTLNAYALRGGGRRFWSAGWKDTASARWARCASRWRRP